MTFRELLVRRGIRFRNHSSKGDEIFLCCPFCVQQGEVADQRFRLGVNVESGLGHCFNCGFSSRSVFVQLLRVWALNPAEVGLELEVHLPAEVGPEALPTDYQSLTKVHCDLDRMARRYVLRRGVTMEQVRDKGIGVSFVGKYAYRVIFPSFFKAHLCGFVARDFTGLQEPRYRTSLGAKWLYNIPNNVRRVVLAEGIFKALRIETALQDCGERNWASGAILGSSISEQQMEHLNRAGVREVVLWPDPDKPGREGCVTMAESLQQRGMTVGVVWPIWQPADVANRESLTASWRANVQGISWTLLQSIRISSGGVQ